MLTSDNFCGRVIRGGFLRHRNYGEKKQPERIVGDAVLALTHRVTQALVALFAEQLDEKIHHYAQKKSKIKRNKHIKGNIQQIMHQASLDRYQSKVRRCCLQKALYDITESDIFARLPASKRYAVEKNICSKAELLFLIDFFKGN